MAYLKIKNIFLKNIGNVLYKLKNVIDTAKKNSLVFSARRQVFAACVYIFSGKKFAFAHEIRSSAENLDASCKNLTSGGKKRWFKKSMNSLLCEFSAKKKKKKKKKKNLKINLK